MRKRSKKNVGGLCTNIKSKIVHRKGMTQSEDGGRNGKRGHKAEIVPYTGSFQQVTAIAETIRYARLSRTVALIENEALIVRQFYSRSDEEPDMDEYRILPRKVVLERTVITPRGHESEISDLMVPEAVVIGKRRVVIFGTGSIDGSRYHARLTFPPPNAVGKKSERESPYSMELTVGRRFLKELLSKCRAYDLIGDESLYEPKTACGIEAARSTAPGEAGIGTKAIECASSDMPSEELALWRGVSKEVLFD